jgi:hypothetical protein
MEMAFLMTRINAPTRGMKGLDYNATAARWQTTTPTGMVWWVVLINAPTNGLKGHCYMIIPSREVGNRGK